MGFAMEEKLSGLPTIPISILEKKVTNCNFPNCCHLHILLFVEFNEVGNTENNAITPLDEFNVLHSRTLNIFRLIRVIIACHQRHLSSSNYFSD